MDFSSTGGAGTGTGAGTNGALCKRSNLQSIVNQKLALQSRPLRRAE